jgi:hypothetical protein
MRSILLGAVTGGIIALITTKIAEQFIYSYFRRPAPYAILIALFSLLVVGFILYRGRKTHIPIKTILIFALVFFVVNVFFDFILVSGIDAYYNQLTASSNLNNFTESLLPNLHWLVGGTFVGVMTAAAIPFLQRYNLQYNLPFLAVLAVFLIYFAFVGGFSIINDSDRGFGVSRLPAIGFVLGGMLAGAIVARQARKAIQLTSVGTT